jgi:hypothetical protein
MTLISRKKAIIPISPRLREILGRHGRELELPVRYEDLARYGDTTPVYDKHGRDSLWESVLYTSSDRKAIGDALVRTYALLKVKGDMSLMTHLITDRVDVCTYGNTQPFRIRILNTLNENFDYFYVKRADASRIYGLELEHLLAPARIEFNTHDNTVVEEHVAGIPGDTFCREWLADTHLDEVRLAKEFVKFNERCFLRLLGDMHSGNFVVDVTPDFDETSYRIRPIDFDQQSYERRARVYLPQYYKENNPIIRLGLKRMTAETTRQYQQEERTLMRSRAQADGERLREVLDAMRIDTLAPRENVLQLRDELADHHEDSAFHRCESMGELVVTSLDRLDWT